jgi:hypothetical protein
MRRFSIYLLLYDAVQVSDGFFIHHQKLKTVRTASGICQTVTATQVAVTVCMCSFVLLMMDGKTV